MPHRRRVHPGWDTRLRHEYFANTVSVIATATNTVVATVTVNVPVAVAVSPNGQDVYVAKRDGTNKVRVIATATNTKVAAIPVGLSPLGRHWAMMPLTFSPPPPRARRGWRPGALASLQSCRSITTSRQILSSK